MIFIIFRTIDIYLINKKKKFIESYNIFNSTKYNNPKCYPKKFFYNIKLFFNK